MTDTKDTLQKIYAKSGKALAYRAFYGQKSAPTIVFLGGYGSDMTGSKATFLDSFCREKGYSFLRFDYSGNGSSEGEFKDGTIGQWTEDALTIINHAAQRDVILVGSSMGGWIGLKVAMVLGQRVKAFIGIAAAPDFTDWVWAGLSEGQREDCARNGQTALSDGGFITYRFLQDGLQQRIMDKPINLPCPVILLQGKQDATVPYQVAEKLAAHITSPTPVSLILIDDGDHRLTRPQDLELLAVQLEDVLERGD